MPAHQQQQTACCGGGYAVIQANATFITSEIVISHSKFDRPITRSQSLGILCCSGCRIAPDVLGFQNGTLHRGGLPKVSKLAPKIVIGNIVQFGVVRLDGGCHILRFRRAWSHHSTDACGANPEKLFKNDFSFFSRQLRRQLRH